MTHNVFVRLKDETHNKLKIICVKDRISIQRFVEDLIENAIQNKDVHKNE